MFWGLIDPFSIDPDLGMYFDAVVVHTTCHAIFIFVQNGPSPSAIYSESIQPLYVLHSGLKREWQPIFSTFCGQKKFKKKIYKSFFMQLFSAVAKKI